MPAEPDPLPAVTANHTARVVEPKEYRPPQGAGLFRQLRQLFRVRHEHSLKEALQEVLDEHDESSDRLMTEEMNLLRNMVAFSELKVGDVMVPRTDILAVADTVDVEGMSSFIATHRHTRVPVYHETLDHITGFIHIKDVFLCLADPDKPFDVQALKRDILFIPASMKIIDLLLKMRLSSCHMAIVVDEYGGTDGLVTMEDLFEEIVGEIQDEHDDDEVLPEIRWISDKALEADARVDIEDLMKEMPFDLIADEDREDFDTLGGLIFNHIGRIPAKGEVIDYSDVIKFEILSADPRRIRKVRVVQQSPAQGSLALADKHSA